MITVSLLGCPGVAVDGKEVELPPRAIGVVARLALQEGRVSRDRLLVDLWGADADPSRVRSLETLVSRARRALSSPGQHLIAYDQGGYRLDRSVVTTDVDWLREHARQAREAAASDDQAAARMEALAGLELWDGDSGLATLGRGAWVDDLEIEVRGLRSELQDLVLRTRAADRYRPTGVTYVVNDGRHLAHHSFGHGEPDVMLLGGLSTHLEGQWNEPGWAAWVSELASRNRVITFDKRGTGLSDPIAVEPTIDDFAEDSIDVLNAVASQRAVLLCCGEAGLFGPRVAVREPDRIAGVVFLNAIPKVFDDDGYAPGIRARVGRDFFYGGVKPRWGSEAVGLDLAAPSMQDDVDFVRWATRYQRLCATPGSVERLALFTSHADARDDVRSMAQPALVLQSQDSRYFNPTNARWFADHARDAKLVTLKSADHLYWLPEPQVVHTEIADFVGSLSVR